VTIRLLALLATEWRLQWRHRIPAAVAGLAVAWTGLVVVLPAAAPYLLFIETATIGTWLVGALAIMDRASGVTAALTVSPARPAERATARIAPMAAVTVLAALPVMLAAGVHRYPAALASLVLSAVLLLAIGLGVAAHRTDLIGYLTALPWPLIPLLAVPLGVATGLLTNAGWYAVPTTGALDLIRAGSGPPSRFPVPAVLGYLAIWAALACGYAVRALAMPEPDHPMWTIQAARHPAARRGWPTRGPQWLSFVRADLRAITRDSILVPIVLSPLLLGVVLRFGYPPLSAWLARTHDVDLTPYRPVIALLAVVLHVPVIAGMVGALLVLDDRDSGALDVIRVSPLGTRRYLTYRLGLISTFTAGGLAVAAPLSGLVPASAWTAVVLAVPVGPLFALATLAVAGSRVEGIAAVKALGIPAYAPLAAWWLTGPAGWLLVPLPGYWVVRTFNGPQPLLVAGGLICAGLWLLLLGRRAGARI
jgi:hypothetical protein